MKSVVPIVVAFLVGCASLPSTADQYRISLSIQNDSWEASRVRVLCGDGTHITNINGLAFVQTTNRTVPIPPHCESIRLMVMGYGRESTSDSRVVISSELVCARINSLMQTVWDIGCQSAA